jgi:hypothetical protein
MCPIRIRLRTNKDNFWEFDPTKIDEKVTHLPLIEKPKNNLPQKPLELELKTTVNIQAPVKNHTSITDK